MSILPYCLLILLGYAAGRGLDIKREAVARLLIYIIVPAVVFGTLATASLDARLLYLPVLFFMLCCLICLLALAGLKAWGPSWASEDRHILAFGVASGNTGYFGLPVAVSLFGPESASLVILAGFGFVLFENTLGFFITARGRHTAGESLRKVIRLPSLYAFALGLAVNASGYHLPSSLDSLILSFRGAYIVLGMMIIGMGLASLGDPRVRLGANLRFTGLAFVGKFLVWPVFVGILIFLDRAWLGWYDPSVHQVMLMLAVVPMPANSVALASALGVPVERVSLAVLLSTIFALFYVPWMVALVR